MMKFRGYTSPSNYDSITSPTDTGSHVPLSLASGWSSGQILGFYWLILASAIRFLWTEHFDDFDGWICPSTFPLLLHILQPVPESFEKGLKVWK